VLLGDGFHKSNHIVNVKVHQKKLIEKRSPGISPNSQV
jgi:hypothetical protein